jgi:hypothetical protein
LIRRRETVHREIRALWLALAVSALLAGACKQKSKEEAEPAVTPSASAAPAETAAATPPPPDTIPPPTQPPTAAAAAAGAAKGGGESLKTCCTALHKEESTVPAAQKSLYTQAGATCDAISQLVAKGVTKKAAALTQLRASLKGNKLPAGCD